MKDACVAKLRKYTGRESRTDAKRSLFSAVRSAKERTFTCTVSGYLFSRFKGKPRPRGDLSRRSRKSLLTASGTLRGKVEREKRKCVCVYVSGYVRPGNGDFSRLHASDRKCTRGIARWSREYGAKSNARPFFGELSRPIIKMQDGENVSRREMYVCCALSRS